MANVDPSNTLDLGESFGGGIELGYNFSDYWTARLEYTLHHFNIENNNDHSKAERFGIDALYHFDDSSCDRNYYCAGGDKQICSETNAKNAVAHQKPVRGQSGG